MSDKILTQHLARKAVLYVRQSSAHQVLHNQESQRLQYAMRNVWRCSVGPRSKSLTKILAVRLQEELSAAVLSEWWRTYASARWACCSP